jgi:hypothetical protein
MPGSRTFSLKSGASMLQGDGAAADGGNKRQRRRLTGTRGSPARQFLLSPWSLLPTDVVREIMTRYDVISQKTALGYQPGCRAN